MRKFFSGVTFSLFCIFIVPLLFVFSFSRTYFSENFYRGPFVDRIYDFSQDLLVDQTVSSGEFFDVVFSREDIRPIVMQSFDRIFFEKIVSRLVDQFHRLSPENPNIQLDFQNLREPLRRFFSRIADLVLASRPVCAIDQIPMNDSLIPSCIPAAWKTPAFQKKFNAQLDHAFEKNFFRQFESRSGFPGREINISFQQNIKQIQQFKDIVFYLPFIAVGILFFLALLTFFIYGKPFSNAFSSMSKMFFVSSLLVAASGFLFSALPEYLKAEYFPPDSSSFFATFRASLKFLLSPFSSEFFLYAGILFLFSALFYFLGRSKIYS